MPNYSWVIDILNDEKNINTIENKELFLKSDILKIIRESYPKITDDRIVFANIQSMCLTTDPTKIRIRSDKFLRWVKNFNFDCMLVSIAKHFGKKYYYIFLGKSFEEYCFSDYSSNSFLNFNFEDLFPVNGWKENYGIKIKTVSNRRKEKSKYFYYVSEDALKSNDDINKLKDFCERFIKQIPLEPYPKIVYKALEITPGIRKKVFDLFPNRCICSVGENICINKDSINWNSFEKNPSLTSLHLHHFIPKEHFRNMYNVKKLNTEIINSYLNLVPLCPSCHSTIHKGNDLQKMMIINKIFEVQKKLNIHNDFLDYLKNNEKYIKMTIEKIIAFYLKRHK